MIVVGLVFGAGVLTALAPKAPFVLLGLGILVSLARAGTRLEVLTSNDETTRTEGTDPLTVLQATLRAGRNPRGGVRTPIDDDLRSRRTGGPRHDEIGSRTRPPHRTGVTSEG